MAYLITKIICFLRHYPKYFNPENNSHINPYSDVCYYYIRIGGENGLRMSAAEEPWGAQITHSTHFTIINFLRTMNIILTILSLVWPSLYYENTHSFNFDFPNLITSSPLTLKVHAASAEQLLIWKSK